MKLPFSSITYGKRLNPNRDWRMIITVASVALVVSLAWNLWIFRQVSEGTIIGGRAAPSPSAVDQSRLDTIAEVFTSRAREAAKYTNGEYRFIDPSQ